MQPYNFLYHSAGEEEDKSWIWFIGGSLLIHVLIFVAVVFFPFSELDTNPLKNREVIQVDLASIDARAPQPPRPEPSGRTKEAAPEDFAPKAKTPPREPQKTPEEPAVAVKKAPAKDFDPSDYVVEKPKPRVKQSMKKRTFQSEAVHRSAVERVKEKSTDSRPRSVADRINALKSEVAGQKRKLSDQSAEKRRTGQGGGGRAVTDMSQIEIYQAEVAVAVKNNWVFSERLAGGKTQGLESRLVIKIMPDGSITDVWYAKRSGNSYLDQSAYKTVMKTDPLPPLPDGYPYYHLMLGFTPSGLRR